MTKWILLVLLTLTGVAEAACPPVRDNTYVRGEVIEPEDVTRNEDALFDVLQDGIGTDCLADNAVTTGKIATGGVTSADILDGTITTADLAFSIDTFNALPAGSVFFMLTGSCPAWTTDISATYANYFPKISATQGVTGGSSAHTHTAGTYATAAHDHQGTFNHTSAGHSTPGEWVEIDVSGDGTLVPTTGYLHTIDSDGNAAITGVSGSASADPLNITMKACRVD